MRGRIKLNKKSGRNAESVIRGRKHADPDYLHLINFYQQTTHFLLRSQPIFG